VRGRAVGAVEILVIDQNAARAARARIGNGDGHTAIAIRTRIVPAPWGVPDKAILRAARPITDPALEGLLRLVPADAFVCSLVDASAAGLRIDLARVWDARAALREEPVDMERIASVVASLSAPRAFWVPARVLAARAGVPIPPELLSLAPDDLRQRRLERVAGRRLFRERSASPMAEWSFRWAWPVLASGSTSDFGRRLPSAVARAARELPSAWRELGGCGVSGAFRDARRVVATWSSSSR